MAIAMSQWRQHNAKPWK